MQGKHSRHVGICIASALTLLACLTMCSAWSDLLSNRLKTGDAPAYSASRSVAAIWEQDVGRLQVHGQLTAAQLVLSLKAAREGRRSSAHEDEQHQGPETLHVQDPECMQVQDACLKWNQQLAQL